MPARRKPAETLPPLAFAEAEIDALLLGLAMVAAMEDEDLAEPARAATARLAAALPAEPPYRPGAKDPPLVRTLRAAIAAEHSLRLRYTDGKGVPTERSVWPIALTGDDMLAAWCEARQDFRHFRLDRMQAAEATGARYPTRRRVLQAAWWNQQIGQGRW